jgi:hypothetical protein
MREALSLLPGVGHALHDRPQRAVAFGAAWLAFLAVLWGNRGEVGPALADRAFDGKLAVVFLLASIVALPAVSWADCRRLRSAPPIGCQGESQWKMVYRRFMRNNAARSPWW